MSESSSPWRRVLVFGAAAHIGGPLARYVAQHSPRTLIRAATSSPDKLEAMRSNLPDAECIVASYFDVEALTAALTEVDAVFVITPDFLDETRAMNNLVDAVRRVGTVKHIVRITGDPPGIDDESKVP